MVKRETIGQHLKREYEAQEMSAVKLSEKILREYGFEVGASTILATLDDKTPNTGRKTLEFICLGLGLDPLQVFAIGLETPQELDPDSKFGHMARLYKEVAKSIKPRIDLLLEILVEQMKRRR